MKLKLLLITLLIITGILGVYFYQKNRGVHDYDSCIKAGYPGRLLNCQGCPKFCDTPWGVSFSKKQ